MNTRPHHKPSRDFEAERRWLLRLPPGPETDQRQDEWERDPEVRLWRARQAADDAAETYRRSIADAIRDHPALAPEEPTRPE